MQNYQDPLANIILDTVTFIYCNYTVCNVQYIKYGNFKKYLSNRTISYRVVTSIIVLPFNWTPDDVLGVLHQAFLQYITFQNNIGSFSSQMFEPDVIRIPTL
jgi:hypothetical protein